MKNSVKKIYCLLFCLCFINACTSSNINDEIPLSSSDLIDENVVYKSETPEVVIEDVSIVEKNKEDEKIEKIEETENPEVIIVDAKNNSEENVNFVNDSYVVNDTDEFNKAVIEAQELKDIRKNYKKDLIVENKKESIIEENNVVEVKKINKKLNIVEQKKANITFLSTIIYHSNTKADVSEKDMKALKNVVKFVKEKNADITVVGNASSRSKDMTEIQNKIENFDLSLKRAQTVANILNKLGVPSEKIIINAVGDAEKVVEENMPSNEAINRRTEIYINY